MTYADRRATSTMLRKNTTSPLLDTLLHVYFLTMDPIHCVYSTFGAFVEKNN